MICSIPVASIESESLHREAKRRRMNECRNRERGRRGRRRGNVMRNKCEANRRRVSGRITSECGAKDVEKVRRIDEE